MNLAPWPGRKVAVLTQSGQRDQHVMENLVGALDKAYVVYEHLTGSDPGPNPQGTLNGLDIIAEVPDSDLFCPGAACTYPGAFGSEIGTTYFNQLYDGIRLHDEYDQAMFYEFGRSFWFYQDQLGTIDPFVTGFAIANRFISLDRAGLKGGPFGELSYSEFKKSILVDFLKSYLADPSLTWRNTLLVVDKRPIEQYSWSVADLAGSMIYQIYRDVGFTRYQAFWKILGKQPVAQTPDDAIRNFLAAARAATGQNYGFLFKDNYSAVENTEPSVPPTWVCEVLPLLQKERDDIPLDFLLGWIKVESNGNMSEVTRLDERGYFQLMKSESDELGLEHKRLSTDKDYSLRAGLQLVALYGRTAEAYGFKRTDSALFWRMVKLVHAMGPGSVKTLLRAMQLNGIPPSSWESIETFASSHRADLLKSIKHDPVKWTANVDKIFMEGRVLERASNNCAKP